MTHRPRSARRGWRGLGLLLLAQAPEEAWAARCKLGSPAGVGAPFSDGRGGGRWAARAGPMSATAAPGDREASQRDPVAPTNSLVSR